MGFQRRLTLPPGDVLIHSGDFDGGSVEEIDDFNSWLGSLPFRHKIVIAGNHDLLFDRKPKLARAHLTKAIYLQDSGVTIEGVKFWGSPVNSVGGDWAFARERLVKIRSTGMSSRTIRTCSSPMNRLMARSINRTSWPNTPDVSTCSVPYGGSTRGCMPLGMFMAAMAGSLPGVG